ACLSFFFQAEDGIRVFHVTGVQTCALPISAPPGGWAVWSGSFRDRVTVALFIFFLLPTVLFGALAYRTLAGEATRAGRIVAAREIGRASCRESVQSAAVCGRARWRGGSGGR